MNTLLNDKDEPKVLGRTFRQIVLTAQQQGIKSFYFPRYMLDYAHVFLACGGGVKIENENGRLKFYMEEPE